MYIALYTREFMEPRFKLQTVQRIPENQSYDDAKIVLLRENGSLLGDRYQRVLPTARISDLPDELENLDVDQPCVSN